MFAKRGYVAVASAVFLGFGTLLADGPLAFQLEKNSGGVAVYTRKVEGSSLKEFKGITTIRTSLTALVALMDDTASYTRWLHNVTEASLVQKMSTFERVTYTVIHAPWPVSDRDTVTHSKIVQDPKTKIITIFLRGVPGSVPVKPGKVRVPALNGFWQFIPNKNGNVTVVYQVHSNPGGSLPDALANSTATDIPLNTLRKMRVIVQEAKYQGAKIPEVKELHK